MAEVIGFKKMANKVFIIKNDQTKYFGQSHNLKNNKYAPYRIPTFFVYIKTKSNYLTT